MVTSLLGDQLTTDGADALLSHPEVAQEGFIPKVISGFVEKPLFKVEFPIGVIWIGVLSDLDVSPNGNVSRFEEFDSDLLTVVIDSASLEDIAVMVFSPEVLLENP